jgi:4-oxalocrotonate tautomerase
VPLVRIDVPEGKTADYRRDVADVIYQAMTGSLSVPEGDQFMIITEHKPGNLAIDPGYLGISRSKDAILVQVTLNEGRSVAPKQDFYRAVAHGLRDRVGMRPEDVMINLVEVPKENWR